MFTTEIKGFPTKNQCLQGLLSLNFVENSEESKPKYDTENNLNINKTYEETNLLFPYASGLFRRYGRQRARAIRDPAAERPRR